jgi:ribosomal protein RSM22 (predicted rRNA methylase)
VILPGNLNVALSRWLADEGRGGLSLAASDLSRAYKAGSSSSAVSLAAYVATRVPATFAANGRVLEALTEAWPAFAPRTLLDVGAGPGVASWAVLARWPDISQVTQIERDTKFVGLARRLNSESDVVVLQKAEVRQVQLQAVPDVEADLVVASYVLAELPLQQMALVSEHLWAAATQALVLIEPGTPQGFGRLRVIREHLLKRGANVVAPCTHAAACPMAGDDWCHFKVRLARSREHMHAKGAVVPFEDEAFSYLVFSKQPLALTGARIIAPPEVNKPGISLQLCGALGLATEVIARRDKGPYKIAKRKRWGDPWT